MGEQQIFSETEVAEIVKSAAELQERLAGDGKQYVPGVTREELERVAKEMGIDSAYLDKAIQDRLNAGNSSGTTFLGAQLTREFEQVVPGEIPIEDFDIVMDEIGSRRKSQHTTQVGRSLTSTIMAGLGFGQLNVVSRDGRTRIKVRSIPVFAGLMTFYPAFIGSMIYLARSLSHVIVQPSWMPFVVLVAVAATAWGVFGMLSKRSHKAVQELTNRIASKVAEITKKPGDANSKSEDAD